MADVLHGPIDDILPPAGDDDLRSLFREELCGRFADAAIATGDDGDPSLRCCIAYLLFNKR